MFILTLKLEDVFLFIYYCYICIIYESEIRVFIVYIFRLKQNIYSCCPHFKREHLLLIYPVEEFILLFQGLSRAFISVSL